MCKIFNKKAKEIFGELGIVVMTIESDECEKCHVILSITSTKQIVDNGTIFGEVQFNCKQTIDDFTYMLCDIVNHSERVIVKANGSKPPKDELRLQYIREDIINTIFCLAERLNKTCCSCNIMRVYDVQEKAQGRSGLFFTFNQKEDDMREIQG